MRVASEIMNTAAPVSTSMMIGLASLHHHIDTLWSGLHEFEQLKCLTIQFSGFILVLFDIVNTISFLVLPVGGLALHVGLDLQAGAIWPFFPHE